MYSELKKMKISIREFFEMQQKHYSEKTENTTEEDGLNLNFYFIQMGTQCIKTYSMSTKI